MRRLVMATTSAGRSSYFSATAHFARDHAAVLVGALLFRASWAAAGPAPIRTMTAASRLTTIIEQRARKAALYMRFIAVPLRIRESEAVRRTELRNPARQDAGDLAEVRA